MSLQDLRDNLKLYYPISNAVKEVHSVLYTSVNLKPQLSCKKVINCLMENFHTSTFYDHVIIMTF